MGLSVLPSEILAKRMALVRTLLGPGWLPQALADGPSAGTVRTWVQLERCYGRLARWLERGLGHLCRLGSSSAGEDGGGDADWLEDLSGRDVPVAVMHALREGVVVTCSGIRTCCNFTAGDLLEWIVPLLAWLYCLNDRRVARATEGSTARRCLVLLAGVPGGGKSVAAALVERFGRLLRDFPRIQVVGMDGWHLASRAMSRRWITDVRGNRLPLTERKGSPQSFDLQGLTRDVRGLVMQSATAKLPYYDRQAHEPVAGRLLVDSPIVLLEGNYLALKALGWEKLAELACGVVWLDAPLGLAERSIVLRHMLCGRSRIEAESRWVRNDWPNALVAIRGRPNADAVLVVDGMRRMHFVHRC